MHIVHSCRIHYSESLPLTAFPQYKGCEGCVACKERVWSYPRFPNSTYPYAASIFRAAGGFIHTVPTCKFFRLTQNESHLKLLKMFLLPKVEIPPCLIFWNKPLEWIKISLKLPTQQFETKTVHR